jgi:NADH:ubiquinone oxidoreductase subunit H
LFFCRSSHCYEYRFDDSAVIPWGRLHVWKDILQADLNIGYYTFEVVGVYGIMIGGWASNNKFSLVPFVQLLKWYRMKLQWDCP